LKKLCLAQWCTPVIPATQVAEGRRSQTNAAQGKSVKSYLKNKLKAKGLSGSTLALQV
jgi:hypothetical protein